MKSVNLLNRVLIENKRILLRGDLDVPIQDGKIVDASRLEAMRETLDYLILRGAKVILIGHLGRPEGKITEDLRLNPISEYLSSYGYNITKLDKITGPEVTIMVNSMSSGSILLLENLRFDSREEANDDSLVKELAAFGDIYVNECFSACHRAHASIMGVPLAMRSYAGLRLTRETEELSKIISKPKKPLVGIVGGAKLETKLPVISKLLTISDYVLLGGKLGLHYEGDNNYKVLVPIDYSGNKEDIGPETIKMYKNVIRIAKTIIWNGPMGKIEVPEFLEGSRAVAEAIAESDAYSLVGGGDTLEALEKTGFRDKIDFVSMGGGAMLDFITGKKLPGLTALNYYG